MPRPVGNGRPGTTVIPADWAAIGGAVVDTTHDCTVTVGPPGVTPAWVEARGQTETVAADPVYAGGATITPVVEDGALPLVAEADQVPVRRYEVKLARAAAGVQAGHVVVVSASPDPDLPDGSRLVVRTVEVASRRFSRVLQADLVDQP